MGHVEYDEFGLFGENAAEFGLPYDAPPVVRRESVEVRPGHHLSALVWGDAAPELVLLHGGGQNAHTWDTVAMAVGRPLVAIDLPGHGHSDGSIRGALSLDAVALEQVTRVPSVTSSGKPLTSESVPGGTVPTTLPGSQPPSVAPAGGYFFTCFVWLYVTESNPNAIQPASL
jgi:pimeloyl-ACP methyl ester carboxylesterase